MVLVVLKARDVSNSCELVEPTNLRFQIHSLQNVEI